ncbi:hypothetical protein ACOMHN_024444 [Nucella lapillus]
MEGFDDAGIFYSDSFQSEGQTDGNQIDRVHIKSKLKEFVRQFHEGNFSYRYRDQLKRQYNLGQYFLEVALDDVTNFDEQLAENLTKMPSEYLPLFEEAAKDVADEVTRPRPDGDDNVEDIQVMLTSGSAACGLRQLKSDQMSRLVKIPGIVISSSGVKSKATRLAIQCRGCSNVLANIHVKPGLEGYSLPRKCNSEMPGRPKCPIDPYFIMPDNEMPGRPKCPIDPYFIMPDKCRCVDFQMLKLQEAPENVPNGEMPRHMTLYCDRYLCDRVVPGNRVTVIGIYSIKKVSKPSVSTAL